MIQANIIATSGRAVEAAGDVDVLLLDKTGTITLGNRQATAFLPAPGVTQEELADAAQLSSLADETPEGRSIVVLAKEKYGIREREVHALGATFVPFSAQTRMSGVNLDGHEIRKGAAERDRGVHRSEGRIISERGAVQRGSHREAGRHAARRRRDSRREIARARRDSTQGHRQRRNQGALRRAPPHGDQDRDDHRRQPATPRPPSQPRRASTITSRKRRPRRSSRSFASIKRADASSR